MCSEYVPAIITRNIQKQTLQCRRAENCNLVLREHLSGRENERSKVTGTAEYSQLSHSEVILDTHSTSEENKLKLSLVELKIKN